MKKLSLLLGLFSFMLLLGMARATTYECNSATSCCETINNGTATSGDIVNLIADINLTSKCGYGAESGIDISVGDIIFDCQGHSIALSHFNDPLFVSIGVTGENNTIRNCNFSKVSNYGITIYGIKTVVINSTFTKSPFDTGGATAVRFFVGNNTVKDSYFINTTITISSGESTSPSNNIIDNITQVGTLSYIYFSSNDDDDADLTGNVIKNSRLTKLVFYLGDPGGTKTITGNYIYNNLFNSSIHYEVQNKAIGSNFWNTTKTSATNIIGGAQSGGNYWAYPNGTGYSQTCDNTNNDSFCDVAYTFNPTDYLPLTNNYSSPSLTPPDISWNSPTNNSVTQNQSWIFWNATISETGGSAILNINGTANYTMSWSGNYSYYNFTGSNTTTYCGKIYANDSSGNMNLSSTRCATINLTSYSDTTPPTITITLPQNISYATTSTMLNVSANEAINTWKYSLNGGANTTFTPNITLTATQGSNNIRVWANDSFGNSNTAIVYFFVDSVPPTIAITSPTNVNYTTTTIALDVSADETIDTWWYSLNSGANASFTPNTTISAIQGTNNLTVYANDSMGNIGGAGVSFFVDSIAPDITWNTPANNSVTQNSSFIFWNVTLSETGTCELDLNSSLNITMNVNGLYCSYDFAGANTTTYCGRAYASDIFGNMNLSSSRCVTINLSMADIVPPNISIASPTATTYTTSDIALTVSANEPINTWWYNLNGGANASFTPNTTISGLTNGVYTLTIYANDLFGNVGMNSAVFTVQIPVISNLGMFAPIAGIAIGGGFLMFIIGLFLEEGANLARDPKKLAVISVGILIVAVLLSALFV